MWTLGADPEAFVQDARTGQAVPAIGMIGGTKKEPLRVQSLSPEYGFQEDNVMAEFNIPPATSWTGFVESIGIAKDELLTMLRENSDNTLELAHGACARMFDEEALAHPQARVFGCDADYDAYCEGQAFPTVSPDRLAGWRFAGGHVHIGISEHEKVPPFVMAQFADVYLGLPSLAWDDQMGRRELYGQPGRYRPKPYGIEYRTLSNLWIWEKELTIEVARQAALLAAFLDQTPVDELQAYFAEIPWHDVRKSIMEVDQSTANDLMDYIHGDLGVMA